MKVIVRSIAAQCPRCGSEDFDSSTGKRMPLASDAVMHCVGCGADTSYFELIVQIAEKARARSQAALEELRNKRDKGSAE